MERAFLSESALRTLAEALEIIYPYKANDILNVMLQTRSTDVTMDIVHYCNESKISLNSGVYYYLRYKDEERTQ